MPDPSRPWCCPEPRCTPVHQLQGADASLDQPTPGETFICFGAAPAVRFEYDGVEHVNDTRSCTYTPLKGVISYQENADDWRAIANAYSRAVTALLRHREGDEGARNTSADPAPRPHCGAWPFPASDLDIVLPDVNTKVHRARGCCDG